LIQLQDAKGPHGCRSISSICHSRVSPLSLKGKLVNEKDEAGYMYNKLNRYQKTYIHFKKIPTKTIKHFFERSESFPFN